VETLPQNQPGSKSHVYQQAMAQLRVLERSPPSCPLYGPKITPDVWEDDFAPPTTTASQETHLCRLTLRHRTVSYDWSKVALRVMVDAAVEAGHYLLTQTPLNSTPYLMN
jgi:hypothetical protein